MPPLTAFLSHWQSPTLLKKNTLYNSYPIAPRSAGSILLASTLASIVYGIGVDTSCFVMRLGESTMSLAIDAPLKASIWIIRLHFSRRLKLIALSRDPSHLKLLLDELLRITECVIIRMIQFKLCIYRCDL